MTVSYLPSALLVSREIVLIPRPLRVCGSCSFWIGPRVRHGLMGYAALRGVIGRCVHRMRQREIPEPFADDAFPMSSPDCPLWEIGTEPDGAIAPGEAA